LASVGDEVRISRHALFFSPERISIGDNTRIDAFSIVSAGERAIIVGRHVHISAYVAILGRGGVEIGDFSALSPRVTILSSTDDFSGASMLGPTIPEEFRTPLDAMVRVGSHVVVGAGSIVLPGITVADSSAVGAASLVTRDVLPFTIVAGVPAMFLRERSHEHLDLAERYLAQEGDDSVGGPSSE
jgi:galactoside O-acetyltransferase